jgi:hypothetical protein
MKEYKTKCYLCGNTRAEEATGRIGESKKIECATCSYYEITMKAFTHYFNREDEREILDATDLAKLSQHVQRNYNPFTQKPVQLNIEDIKRITGKA